MKHPNFIHVVIEGRWCSQCKAKKHQKGGENIAYNNGRNQRWICCNCVTRNDERKRNGNTT